MRITFHCLIAYVSVAVLTNNLRAQAPSASSDTNSANAELKKKQDQLTLENSLADLQLKKDLAKLTAEKQRLELENSLAAQKSAAELLSMQTEIDKLTKQLDLTAKRTAMTEAERRKRLDEEFASDRERIERLRLSNDLASVELASKSRDMAQREQELRIKAAELATQSAELNMQLAKLNTDLDLREKRDQWKNRVNRDIAYTKEPFKDSVLTISDRRISLNGPIMLETADFIVERIDYFNNQNREYPIFLVIDRSPGGSVMAGYKILKAMAGSPAPVYVVVKSFAASMAAGITTLAQKSFAYPNAIMLHHQILSSSFGNLTQQKEQLKEMEEWWKRLATPVAGKMGVGLDDFIKRMYENRSTGDWQEFGDGARKLKWVDEIAETIREESYDRNPDGSSGPGSPRPARADAQSALPERVDTNGKRYVLLPRLEPVDCYYMYNPDAYYRLTP